MKELALTLRPSPLETPTSYLSRLAARNHSDDLMSFCYDTGVSLGDVARGEAEAVGFVERLAGLNAGTFSATTIIKLSSGRYVVGEEPLDSHTLNRGEVRVCPQCVEEEIALSKNLWGAFRPLHWQLPQVLSCTAHNLELVALGYKTNMPSRLDIVSRIRAHLDELPSLKRHRPADAVDNYFSERVYGHKDGRWADCLNIPGLWRCSEALGTLLLHGTTQRRSRLGDIALRQAFVHGFDLLSSGWDRTEKALYEFRAKLAEDRGFQPVPRYGELQRLLAMKSGSPADLEPVRDRLFASCLERYPLPEGTKLFGRVVERRRVHSMRSACQTAQIRREVVEQMLIDRGIGERREDGLFRLISPLTVELVDELTAEKGSFFNNMETAGYLGIREAIFKELARSDVLQPVTGQGHWDRKGYRKDELDQFIDKLMSDAEPVAAVPEGATRFGEATRVAKCSSPDIAKLLLKGDLKACGYLSAKRTIGNLLVDTAALAAALPTKEINGYTFTEVAQMIKASFSTIYAMQELGYLKTVRLKHAQTRVTNDLITPASLQRFKDEFCTLGMIRETQHELRDLKVRDLKRAGLKPVVGGPGMRYVYRWKELPIEALLELVALEPA